jgi:hypothetical protein
VGLKLFQNLIRLRLLDRIRVLHNPLNSLVRKVGDRRNQVLNQSAQSHNCGRDGRIGSRSFAPDRAFQMRKYGFPKPLRAGHSSRFGNCFECLHLDFLEPGRDGLAASGRLPFNVLGRRKRRYRDAKHAHRGPGIPLENGKRERLRRSNPDRLRMEALIYQCKQHRQGCLFQRSVERRVVFTNAAGYHLQN